MKLPISIPTIAQARFALSGLWAASRGIIAVLLALLIVQTVRIEGFKIWPVTIEGLAAKVERLDGDLARVVAAQRIAAQAALDAKAATEAKSKTKAKEIDNGASSELEAGLDDANRHIAANRVWPKAVDCPSSGTFAAASNHRTGDIEGAGATTVLDATSTEPRLIADMVAVRADDVRICTINTIKAEAARDWAVSVDRGFE